MSPGSFFAHPHQAFTAGFYKSDWDFEVRIALGMAVHGGAEPGEVLATIADISDGDHQKWFDSWVALGRRVVAIADSCAATCRRQSAADAYLRAANYLAIAVNAVDGLRSQDPLLPTFREHRVAWDGFIRNAPYAVETVEIPYEETILPGFFFAPDGASAVRPTLIMINGSDGSLSNLWGSGAAGALERGYNVLLFDGPGQQSLLFERNIPFRFDWEAVTTPVVDFLLTRADVDPAKIALYGISQAGYWVPRSLAFEHRIAAAIADPGVVDVSTSWTDHMPKSMIKLLREGNREKFDKEMAFGMKMPGAGKTAWSFRARPYNQTGYYDTMAEVLKYNVTDVAASITTPLLITSPEDEQFWPGQSEKLASLIPGETQLVKFTAAEGANYHCQPLARLLTEQRMLDWLDAKLQG
ncbi:alpha/beta hydrolase family protein [Nakamurella sp. GG22]